MGIASTEGWDVVFGLHIDEINKAIASKVRHSVKFSAQEARAGALEGEMVDWKVATGGDGKDVFLAVAFRGAQLTVGTFKPLAVAGHARVQVRLGFFPAAAANAGIATHQLRVQQTAAAGLQAASVESVDPPFQDSDQEAVFCYLFGLWLNKHSSVFDHVFASVLLDRTAPGGAFQWLQPTAADYSYVDHKASNGGVLAVLCMTGGSSPANLAQQVSADILPAGCQAGFLISSRKLLSQLMLPAMPKIFPGSKAADFMLSPAGDSIKNANPSAGFTVTDAAGKVYQAQLTSLLVSIDAGALNLIATTKATVSPGIRSIVTTTNSMGIQLVNRKDGSQTLSFLEKNHRPPEHSIEHDKAIDDAQGVLLIATIFITAVVTVLTEGAGTGVCLLILGVLTGAFDATVKIIDLVGQNQAPSINDFWLNCTAPIVWGDCEDVHLVSAGLNGSLQIGGNVISKSSK